VRDATGKIFISHSSLDKPVARQIGRRLRDRGYEVWLDERELQLGDSLADSIASALSETPVLIALISKTSITSRWVQYELNQGVVRRVAGDAVVIPLRIDDVDVPAPLAGILYGDLHRDPRGTYRRLWTALDQVDHLSRWLPSRRRIVAKASREALGPCDTGMQLGDGAGYDWAFDIHELSVTKGFFWAIYADYRNDPDVYDVERFGDGVQRMGSSEGDGGVLLALKGSNRLDPLMLKGFSKVADGVWENTGRWSLPVWVASVDEEHSSQMADRLMAVRQAIIRCLSETRSRARTGDE
jgi:hypothetical protein